MFFTVDYQTDLGKSLKSVFFSVNLNLRDFPSSDPPLDLFPPALVYSQNLRPRCSYDLVYRRVNFWLDSETWVNFLVPDPHLMPDLLTWWQGQNPYRLELIGETIPRETTAQLLR